LEKARLLGQSDASSQAGENKAGKLNQRETSSRAGTCAPKTAKVMRPVFFFNAFVLVQGLLYRSLKGGHWHELKNKANLSNRLGIKQLQACRGL